MDSAYRWSCYAVLDLRRSLACRRDWSFAKIELMLLRGVDRHFIQSIERYQIQYLVEAISGFI